MPGKRQSGKSQPADCGQVIQTPGQPATGRASRRNEARPGAAKQEQGRPAESHPGESRQDMASRHRSEWESFRRDLLEPAMSSCDPEEARYVKALADSLKIAQEAERKAVEFGLAAVDTGELRIVWEE